MSAVNVCRAPSGSVTATLSTARPLLSVIRRSALVLVSNVRLGCAARAGRMTAHSASAFAPSRQGNPSTRSQRMQGESVVRPPCASWVSRTPIGR